MSYSSFKYLFCFLGIVFLFYSIIPRKYKWIVLLVSSYVFYFLSSRKLVVFLIFTTLVIYITGLILNKIQKSFEDVKGTLSRDEKKIYKHKVKRKKKAVIAICIVINMGLLVFLKYYNFLGGALNVAFRALNISFEFPALKLVLPLGISFYTLMAVSYVVDVYWGKYPGEKNLGKLALFLSFFPHIVEGPFDRYNQLSPQLYEGHRISYNELTFGLQMILWGLFKKMVIADRANGFVKAVFDSYADYSGIVVVTAMLLYTLQLYAEFSGCMDIVSGSAQIFGIEIAENFRRPFFAKSINDFWRRWHVTLGAWFKDYIFYPISLSKPFMSLSKWCQKHFNMFFGSTVPVIFALFFVWICNGLWHGAGWKYIVYGMYYYLIMVAGMLLEPLFVKILKALHINRQSKMWKVFQIVRTFIIVNIGMLMFRADSLSVFKSMFLSMFRGFNIVPIMDRSLFEIGADAHDFLILGISVIILLVVSILKEKGHSIRQEIASKNIAVRWALYYALIMLIIICGAYGRAYNAADFAYAQF